MKIIGLTGGIAAGKTTVSQALHNLGAGMVCVDPIVHEVLDIPEIVDQMWLRWGEKHPAFLWTFNSNERKVDRHKIADLVFDNPKELEFLEDITAPVVENRMLAKIRLYHADYTPMVVIDAALLFEASWNKYCHETWFVDADVEERLINFLHRDSRNTKEDFYRRQKAQQDVSLKRRASTRIIQNKINCWDATQKIVQTAFTEAITLSDLMPQVSI